MTLLEIVLAIAVAGFVLASAASFVVSITTIWTNREDSNFFEDHSAGVAEFLSASFARAGTEISLESDPSTAPDPEDRDRDSGGDAATGGVEVSVEAPNPRSAEGDGSGDTRRSGGGLLRVSEEPVGWARPPGFARFRDPLLNFRLRGAPPLLAAQGTLPLGGIDAFLHFEADEGLSLLWYPILQEETEDENDLRRTRLSHLVTDLTYIYWDERFERWEEEPAPKEGEGDDSFLLPRFIRLTFTHGESTREHTIRIPVPSKRALLF